MQTIRLNGVVLSHDWKGKPQYVSALPEELNREFLNNKLGTENVLRFKGLSRWDFYAVIHSTTIPIVPFTIQNLVSDHGDKCVWYLTAPNENSGIILRELLMGCLADEVTFDIMRPVK